MKITTSQFAELVALFAKKLPLSMPTGVAREWIDNPVRFETAIASALMPKQEIPITEPPGLAKDKRRDTTAGWTEFYKKYFGIDVDLSGLQIPARVDGFDRLIIVVKGVGLGMVYGACSVRFRCRKDTVSDLGSVVTKNDRNPADDGTYAVWVRDIVEADDGMEDLSADRIIRGEPVKVATLHERLIHELDYFLETGNHLDLRNRTLCSGSRHSDGTVPYVRWYGDELIVSWAASSRRRSGLSSRIVVA